MARRDKILERARAIREGRLQKPTRLDDGEVVFMIPTEDMPVLAKIFPDLVSLDHEIRLKAWHKLRNSPLGEQYLVQRTPAQVKRSPAGIIIK